MGQRDHIVSHCETSEASTQEGRARLTFVEKGQSPLELDVLCGPGHIEIVKHWGWLLWWMVGEALKKSRKVQVQKCGSAWERTLGWLPDEPRDLTG